MNPSESLRRHRAFVFLWFARLAGVAGNQMVMVAVGWQMYDLTGSAWDLGLVGLLQFLPAVALALVAGHVIDRFHRARIVAACMGAQLLVCALLWAGAAGGFAGRNLLLAVSVVLGAVRAFQMPAQQALTPSLVPAPLLPRALAVSAAGLSGAIIAGPALGGFIYAAGAGAVYATGAALFAVAGGLCLAIRYEHSPPPSQPTSWGVVLAGVRFVVQRPVVLGAMSLDLFAVLFGGATALLPIFAKDVLHTGPWGLGLLRGAPAAGALLMSVLLAHRPVRRRSGRDPDRGRGGLRRGPADVRSVDELRALARRAGGQRRGRHDQRRDPPDPDPARDARRDARPRERGQLGVHRRVQPARRIRIRHHRGPARADRLGGARRPGHARRRRAVAAPVPGAGRARRAGARPVGAGTAR